MRAVRVVAIAALIAAAAAQSSGENTGPNPTTDVIMNYACTIDTNCGDNSCTDLEVNPSECIEDQENREWWFSCATEDSLCTRGRYFSDAACTASSEIKDFKMVCGQCMPGTNPTDLSYMYDCTPGDGFVATLKSNCTAGCESCEASTPIAQVGLCMYNPVREEYMAVNDFPNCRPVTRYQAPGGESFCNDTSAAESALTVPQGQCMNLADDNFVVRCPGYTPKANAAWIPIVTPGPTTTSTSAGTTTTTTGAAGPSTTTTTGAPTTTTLAPTSGPTPSPPPTPSATSLTVTTCSDIAYCKPDTCTAQPALNPGACVSEGAGAGSNMYACSEPNTQQCIYAKRFVDKDCSQVLYAENAVCNQCVPNRNGDGFTFFACDVATGTISVSNGCDENCNACGAALPLSVGSCVGSTAFWSFASRPFACSAVNRTSYSTPDCAAGTVTRSVMLPQGACHQGSTFQCNNYVAPPAPTPAPPAPTSPAAEVARVLVQQCTDPLCSRNCSVAESYGSNCQRVHFTHGKLPALGEGATYYTARTWCQQELEQTAVFTYFNDSTCRFATIEQSRTIGQCQRSFWTGRYFTVTASNTIRDACTANCGQCDTEAPLQMRNCTMMPDGRWAVVDRITTPRNIIKRNVYRGDSCMNEPIVVEFVGADTCNHWDKVSCDAVPDATPPPPTTTAPPTPSFFAVVFTKLPVLEELDRALTARYNEPVTAVWIIAPNPIDCAGATCYEAEISLRASNHVRASFFGLESTVGGRAELAGTFNISSLAPAQAPPPAPEEKRSEDKTEIIVIALVASGVALVVIAVVALFIKTKRGGTGTSGGGGGEEYVAGDYVSMQERAGDTA